MQSIRNFIENNFAIILIIFATAGFFLPSFGEFSNPLVIFLVASLVFFSCPEIKKNDLLQIDVFQIGVFSVVRYAVFPIILFYAAQFLAPDYAEGILLLALMPAAMVVASLCYISKAKVSLGLSLTIISSILTPFFVPAIFSFLGKVVEVNILGMFMTLMLVVFVPFIFYFGVISKVKPAKKWVINNMKLMPILIMGLILYIVVAANKQDFISNLDMLLKGGVVMMVTFGMFYLFGILYSFFVPKEQRSAYVYASGATNNGLAIGLAFLYFGPATIFFVAISEVVWCIYVVIAQKFFTRSNS